MMFHALVTAAEEAANVRRELDSVTLAYRDTQALLKVAGGELKGYKLKVCDLETGVASKQRELERQEALLKKQDATVQQLSEAKADACCWRSNGRSGTATSRSQAAVRVLHLLLLRSMFLCVISDLLAFAVPLPDIQCEDTGARLQQVAKVAEQMRVALGKAVGTLWWGDG